MKPESLCRTLRRSPLARSAVLLAVLALGGCERTRVRTTRFGDGTPWTRVHLREGVLHGEVTTWYANGTRRSNGAYASGIPVGRWRTWFLDGKPMSESGYRLGVPDGLWLLWNQAGVQTGAERFQDGRLTGRRALWEDDGDPLIVEHYADGKKHGLRTFFRSDRSVRLEENLLEDRKNGHARTWNAAGTLVESAYWRDDRLHGRQSFYLESGAKLAEGENRAGKREGPWFAFGPEGALLPLAGLYSAGERVADLPAALASTAAVVFAARAPEDLAPPALTADDVRPERP